MEQYRSTVIESLALLLPQPEVVPHLKEANYI